MKNLILIIALFISYNVIGQNKQIIKVIVPNKTDEVYITGNQDALGNWNPAQVKMNKASDYEREISLELTYPAEFKFTKGAWASEGIVKSLANNSNLKMVDSDSKNLFIVKTWMDNIDGSQLGLDYNIKYIDSKLMGDRRMLKVHLPQNYSPEKKYPVIYMTDGGTQNFEVAKGYMNGLSQSVFNLIPETILVAIVHKNRNEELYGQNSGKYFTDHLIQELIPFIDATYSTSGFNAMIGHSNGAEYNHKLMLREDNPFRAFISLSTSFITEPECKEKLTQLFKSYKGEKIYYYIANATLDSPDRIEAGNIFESLYQKKTNTQISFSKETFEANHQTVVPNALLNGLRFIYHDYKSADKYSSIIDFGENYLVDIKKNYGIETTLSINDVEGYIMDILNNKKSEDYEYLISFIEKHKLWFGRGLDPVNIANHYFSMEMYSETIESYNKAVDEFETVEPQVFYANIFRAVKSYKTEGKIAEGITFLEKSRETLSDEYYLRMSYRIAHLSLENNVEVEKGKKALEYCINNFQENKLFSMYDLDKLRGKTEFQTKGD